MVGKDKLFALIESGLAASRATQTEIVALGKTLRVIRFANSAIHQPMAERNVSFFIRVLHEGKVGFASVNGLSEKTLLDAVKLAEANAALPKATPLLERFSSRLPTPSANGYYSMTGKIGSDLLEEKVGTLLERGSGSVSYAGVFWTLDAELAVMNSNGVKLHHAWTAANCQTVATKGDLTGFSAQASPDITQIRPEEVGDNALKRALQFRESVELPPGDYMCLLEEYAVAELALYLAGMAFSADAVEEGRSIIGAKKGQKITHESISMWDDGLNPQSFQLPFDVEGTPRKKVVFIDQGIAKDVVYDLVTAKRFNTESTGHALPDDYSEGPVPLNLEMAGGTSNKPEMLKQMKRGLLVTRFHYIREVHALKTMVTGMTRDGVFLVENGEIVARVKNFRFTESILRAFSTTVALSKERKLVASDVDGGFTMAILVPKMLVEKFAFTGSTKF